MGWSDFFTNQLSHLATAPGFQLCEGRQNHHPTTSHVTPLNHHQSQSSVEETFLCFVLCSSFNEQMLSGCDNTAPLVASSLQLPLFTSFQYLPVFATSKPPLSPQRTPIDPVILCPADNDTDGSFLKLDLEEFRHGIPAVKLPAEVGDLITCLGICLSDDLSQVQQWCVGSKLIERYL